MTGEADDRPDAGPPPARDPASGQSEPPLARDGVPDPPVDPERSQPPGVEDHGELVYDLFRRGSELLDAGDFAAAAIPLEQARALEPDKTSIREALGRAYFRCGRFEKAGAEFAAVVERAPVNDFAHFCLGRALYNIGRRDEARHHAALAAQMRPDRADYRAFRDRFGGE